MYNFLFYMIMHYTSSFIFILLSKKIKHLICQLLSILYKQLCLLQIINCFHRNWCFGFSFFNCHPLTAMKTSCCYWKYLLHWYLTLLMFLISSSNKKAWGIISNATCASLLVCGHVCAVWISEHVCIQVRCKYYLFSQSFFILFLRQTLIESIADYLTRLPGLEQQGLCASTSQCWQYKSIITPLFLFT